MGDVMEIVTFKTLEGVAPEEFLASSRAMEETFARKQPGFVGRTLGRGDGEWVDIVLWQSLTDADAAALAEAASPACRPFFALIDESSIQIARYEVAARVATDR